MRALSAIVVLVLALSACASGTSPSSSTVPEASPSASAAGVASPPAESVAPSDACATAASEPVTLVVMHNWPASDPHGAPMQSLFSTFKAANPNVTIQEEVLADSDIQQKVETGFLAGQEPDLVFENLFAQDATWESKGITVAVDQYLQDWGLADKLLPNAIKEYKPFGPMLAFPAEGFTWPIWYNKAIFDKAGVAIPTTIDELIAAAPKIRAAGFQPFAMAGADWPGQTFLQNMSLAYMTDKEGEELWSKGGFADNPKVKAWIDDFVRMRDAGVFADGFEGANYDQMNQLYYDGKAAMLESGSWAYAPTPAAVAQTTVLGGMPLGADTARTRPTSVQAFTGKGIWVTRNGAKKLCTVRDFIKMWYDPAVQAKFVEDAAMVSALKDVPVDSSKLNPLFRQSLTLQDSTDLTEVMDLWFKAGVDTSVFKSAYLKSTSASDIIQGLQDAWK